MLRPIMKLTKTRRKTSREEEDDLPTISTDIGSIHVGRMNVDDDDDDDDTLDIVQFDNFVDDIEEDEKNDSVRVDPVSSFSSEVQR